MIEYVRVIMFWICVITWVIVPLGSSITGQSLRETIQENPIKYFIWGIALVFVLFFGSPWVESRNSVSRPPSLIDEINQAAGEELIKKDRS